MPQATKTNELVSQARMTTRKTEMNQIAVVQFARMESQRLPGKPFKYVNGRHLIHNCFDKLMIMAEMDNNVHPIFICPKTDTRLIDIADKVGIEYYTLSEEQSRRRIWPDLIEPFLFYLKDYDVVWDANIMCHPFIHLNTLMNIVSLCHNLTFAFNIVTEQRGVIWNGDRTVLLGHNELADTQNNPKYLTPAHIAYCWKQEHLHLREKELATISVPVPLSFGPEELLDIDTPADLEFCQKYVN